MIEIQRAVWFGIVASALALAQGRASEPWEFEAAGVRSGFSATRIDEHFVQLGAFSRVHTPLAFNFSSICRLQTSIDMSAGVLGREEEQGFIGTLGPVLTLSRKEFPIELVGGSSPTILSRSEFGRVNFGIPFQFTSHIGFDVHFTRRLVANYRFQHMSNASLSRHNPGLDLHSVSIGYSF